MIDGIVYKLFCKTTDNCYIGSTTDFHKRKREHKTDCNNENGKRYNYKLYKFIREHNGFDSWEFEILELGEYENKYLLHDREAYFIKSLKPTLNSKIPNRTDKEYYKDNKEKINEYKKEYRKNNKEKIKKYYKDNKEKVKEYSKKYRKDNKENSKKYYKDNKEKINEYKKEYRKDNKDKINKKASEKILCEVCNCHISRSGLSIHKKTKKHIKNLNNL